MKCVIDLKRDVDRPLVCGACRRGLADDLRALVDAYALLVVIEDLAGGKDPVSQTLPAGTVRSGVRDAPVTGSREAPVPVNLDVIDLTLPAGPGAIYDPLGDLAAMQVGLIPVATTLDQWVRDWISHNWCPGDHLPVPTVVTLVGWLSVRLEDACDNHPAIDEFAHEIRRTLHACQRTAGERSDLKRIGPCPEQLDNGQTCGQMLYVHPYADIIECRRCGRRWDRRKQEWLWLGQLLGYDQGEAA